MKWIALAAVMSLTVATAGRAAERRGMRVTIMATTVLTVAATPQYTLGERVSILDARLWRMMVALEMVDDPEVTLKVEDGTPSIYVNGVHFVTVTQYDAELHNSTVEGLTGVWQRHIDGILPELLWRRMARRIFDH